MTALATLASLAVLVLAAWVSRAGGLIDGLLDDVTRDLPPRKSLQHVLEDAEARSRSMTTTTSRAQGTGVDR
jgi:hypothetical protein